MANQTQEIKPKSDAAAEDVRIETDESLYRKGKDRMDADIYIVRCSFQEENYRLAAELFRQAGDYKDAPELAKRCESLADEAGANAREHLYQGCREKEEQAKTVSDWENLEQAYRSLDDYKDASKRAEGSAAQIRGWNRRNRNGWIRGIVIAVILAGGIAAGMKTGLFRYLFAMGYQQAGLYRNAQAAFERLGDFLDSKQKAIESELMGLRSAARGDSVYYGDYNWKVLRRKGDTLLLILQTINDDVPEMYHHAYHDTMEAVTWETCDLRAWLNTKVLEEHFTEAEREQLLPQTSEASVNTVYDTTYPEACEDLITILSAEQARRYAAVLETMGLNWWLRTPGNDYDAAAFYSSAHQEALYGNAVTDEQFAVRPVILVKITAGDTAEN